MTNHYSHIEIKSKEKDGTIFTELYLDGHKVNGVRSMEFKHFSGEIPVLTVDLNALDISTDQTVLMYQRSMEGRPIKSINIEYADDNEDTLPRRIDH